MNQKPTKPSSQGQSHADRSAYVRRPLAEMKRDESYPKLCRLFLSGAEAASADHFAALQLYFKKSFEEAAQILQIAYSGKLAYIGTYTVEVAEAKTLMSAQALSKRSQSVMNFAYDLISPSV